MPPVTQIPRPEWLACYFNYQPGQHAAWFYATQFGKTHHMYQCIEVAQAQNPGLRPPVTLMPKSRSPATRRHAARLGWQIIGDWPPPPRFPWQEKPPGYVLWPKHLKNAEVKVNREHLARVFRKCLSDQFWRGESVTIADDVFNLAVLLHLNDMLEEHLTAGGEGGAGLWLAGQKPSGTKTGALTTFAYNQPEHYLLGYEPIEENRKRFGEIGGGVDTGFVSDYVSHLPRHPVRTPEGIKYISDLLHIDKRGPWLCHVTGL
jgi:hypothetical protein